MVDFDRLNHKTRNFNNRNVSHLCSYSGTTHKYGTSAYWQNYYNNQTYNNNNGQYSTHYSYR